jgi:hypothetical protein
LLHDFAARNQNHRRFALTRGGNASGKLAAFQELLPAAAGENTMERTTVIVAERSAERDKFFFFLGAWCMLMLQMLF